MFYNRKGIQKVIINERKEQERLDSLTLNEWMTPGLRNTINQAAREARWDRTLSWEDLCNPRKSTWTRNLKKAKEDMSGVMFGNTQWDSTGKPDKLASEAMHMAWRPKDYADKVINKDNVIRAYRQGLLNVVWASQFLAGHCFKTAFAKVNEVKGKVTTAENGDLEIDGKFNLFLNYIKSTGHSTTKFFSYGDKYVLMQTGFQRFVLMLIRDNKGRVVNKPAQFERIFQNSEEGKRDADAKRRYEEWVEKNPHIKTLQKFNKEISKQTWGDNPPPPWARSK